MRLFLSNWLPNNVFNLMCLVHFIDRVPHDVPFTDHSLLLIIVRYQSQESTTPSPQTGHVFLVVTTNDNNNTKKQKI